MGNYLSRKKKDHIFSQPLPIFECARVYSYSETKIVLPPPPAPPPSPRIPKTEINWPPSAQDLEIAGQKLLDLLTIEERYI